jgi:hypothetical protein
VKKIDFFSAEKMAINGINWHFSVLPQSRAHFSLGIDAFSAEKIGATQRSAEKKAKHGVNWHFSALPHSFTRVEICPFEWNLFVDILCFINKTVTANPHGTVVLEIKSITLLGQEVELTR